MKLDEQGKKGMLDAARQQFDGFLEGRSHGDITKLANTMGLKRTEWEILRRDSFLPEKDIEALNAYFEKDNV